MLIYFYNLHDKNNTLTNLWQIKEIYRLYSYLSIFGWYIFVMNLTLGADIG